MIFVKFCFSSLLISILSISRASQNLLKPNAEPAELDKECFEKLFPEQHDQDQSGNDYNFQRTYYMIIIIYACFEIEYINVDILF